MRKINTYYHPDVIHLVTPKTFERKAVRGIVLKGSKILLIYTKLYDDYTLPGGGLEQHESLEEGLVRELAEETGAQNIVIESAFGTYEEYRPYYKGYDQMHMISYLYVCTIDEVLQDPKPEAYELANGSVPIWVELDEAIAHNEKILQDKPATMGHSVTRELEIFKLIKQEIIRE